MDALRRLFAPRSVVVIGGGTWCTNVVEECRRIGFDGPIWPVHPTKEHIGGLPAYRSIAALPDVPDAAFVGVNRALTVEIVAQLSALGCGGAVCFAAGFREAGAELADAADLQDRLVAAAGAMRVLGPNCYGFVNALDNVTLWPDIHGLIPVERGVAIIGQSSNILINLTMQRRGLPLAAVVAVGNQAQSSMAEIGLALLEDPRVTALGLHIEGLTDLSAFETLARQAAALKKPIVALKVGTSLQAQAAAVSHTASLAGSDAGARALFSRLGIGQVATPAELVETLKIVHLTGGLASARIVSASCSGGEASLMADLGQAARVEFPALNARQMTGLRTALGPKVALANPLDYNTYIWGDTAALTACFTALCAGEIALGCVVLDFPRLDLFRASHWDKVIDAVEATSRATGTRMALVSLLPEGLPEEIATRAIVRGIVPLCGMREALQAIRAAADVGRALDEVDAVLHRATDAAGPRVLPEADAKALLARSGLRVPGSRRADGAAAAARAAAEIGFPVVLKGEGIAHKTEAGAVILGLRSEAAVLASAGSMAATSFLVEEMIATPVAELIVGVIRDPAHGFVLTIGMGGVLTELVADTVSLLIPSTAAEIRGALQTLRTAPLLMGYRGGPAADMNAIVDAVLAVQAFVKAHADRLEEIEINPLMCLPDGAVAADALIRIGDAT